MTIVAGCDPGLDGALALLDVQTARVVVMMNMPTLQLAKGKGSKREISLRTLVEMIERDIDGLGIKVGHIFIERVSSSPQQGVTSAFTFGEGYGGIKGIVAAMGWPVEYVTPRKWKAGLGVPADKDDARFRACQLMPLDARLWTPERGVVNKAECSGRAEAALIALWGIRSLASIAADHN